MKIGLVKATLFSILIALSGMAAIASADYLTANVLYGNVTLNGADASPETVINAYIEEDFRGSSENMIGSYYISVEGNESDNDKTITFTVCGAAADQTAVWHANYLYLPGRLLDLTAVDDEAPAVTDANANPPSIVNGTDTTQLNVTVIDGCRCTVGNVTVNLSAIGGDAAQEMTRVGDTDVYSVTTNATEGTALGAYDLYVNASDVFGKCNTSVCIPLEVTNVTSAQFTIHLDAGWNMVSIPVIPADASMDAIFGDNITLPVYEYDAGYKSVTTLEPKKGYWVLANSPADIEITGTAPSDLEVTVVSGWNMIGPVSSGVQVSSFTGITPPVYGYDAGYKSVTTLEQTEGYWVLASAETTLIV